MVQIQTWARARTGEIRWMRAEARETAGNYHYQHNDNHHHHHHHHHNYHHHNWPGLKCPPDTGWNIVVNAVTARPATSPQYTWIIGNNTLISKDCCFQREMKRPATSLQYTWIIGNNTLISKGLLFSKRNEKACHKSTIHWKSGSKDSWEVIHRYLTVVV